MSSFTVSFKLDVEKEKGDTDKSLTEDVYDIASGMLPSDFVYTVRNDDSGHQVSTPLPT